VIVYYNGDFCEEGALVAYNDRGFLLGDGIFETILVQQGVALFLERHMERLLYSCRELKIPFNMSTDKIIDLITELGIQNKNDLNYCSVRITVTRGPSMRGLKIPNPQNINPTLMIVLGVAEKAPSKWRYIVSDRRRFSKGLYARHKSLNYLENIMARDDAETSGANEAILLNEHNHIVCGSASNIFLLKENGILVTPAISQGALPGITRQCVLDCANAKKIECEEGIITIGDIETGLLFFTNSLIGIVPAEQEVSNVFKQDLKVIRSGYEKICANEMAMKTTGEQNAEF